MQFTVDYIYKNIDIWESSKQRQDSDCIKPTTDDKVKSPNGIPPQPSPEGKSTASQRPRSGAK